MDDKKLQQLQHLLDNINDIEIDGVYYDSWHGNPTLVINLKDWDMVKEAGFKIENYCVLFE